MLTCVGKTAQLFIVILLLPVQSAPPGADGKRCIEEDQEIGIRNSLPHGGRVGMFLRNVPASVAMFFKPGDQRGFA